MKSVRTPAVNMSLNNDIQFHVFSGNDSGQGNIMVNKEYFDD
jgi:hypothetical protein